MLCAKIYNFAVVTLVCMIRILVLVSLHRHCVIDTGNTFASAAAFFNMLRANTNVSYDERYSCFAALPYGFWH